MTLFELAEQGLKRQQIDDYWRNLTTLETYVFDNHPDVFKDFNPHETEKSRNRILDWYVEIRNKLGRSLTRKDVRDHGGDISIYMVNNQFGGITNLEEEARLKFPEKFKDKPVRHLRNEKSIGDLREVVKKYKRFVITTAVTGTAVDANFYKSLKRFCKQRKAKLLILLCSDPAKSRETSEQLGVIDPVLADETIVFEDTKLNNNLHISTIKLSAKALIPTSGLQRIGKQRGSFIYAAPKFFLEYTSVRNNKDKWPHAIMTTGGITIPDYRSEYYMSERTAYIAEFDHTLGGIYVEIEDEEAYHFRQIECLNTDGIFYFEDKKYTPTKTLEGRPEAMVLGDLHVGSTCPLTRQAWIEMIKVCKPKRIALHDALNGTSINHWIEKDIIERARLAMAGHDSLEKELQHFSEELKFWCSLVEEVLMIPSNHNDWLEKWLRQAKYAKDPLNHYIGLCLAKAMFEGHYPLKYAVEELNKTKLDNLIWLGRNDDYFIGDMQINCHGDGGVNGSRGSITSMETAYGSSMSGHGHTAGIRRRTKRVGTSTYLQEDYNNGPSTWTNTSGFVYPDGSSSLYNAIGGKWRI